MATARATNVSGLVSVETLPSPEKVASRSPGAAPAGGASSQRRERSRKEPHPDIHVAADITRGALAMRVLLTTRGSSGHVTPLAPFGHALVRAGHEVLVAAQWRFEENVVRPGLPFAPTGRRPTRSGCR